MFFNYKKKKSLGDRDGHHFTLKMMNLKDTNARDLSRSQS